VVGAVPVHLASGSWGLVAAGLFTVPSLYDEVYEGRGENCCGLLYGCRAAQLGANLVFLAAAVGWVGLASWAHFALFDRWRLLRIGRLEELVGLDLMYHNDAPDRDQDDAAMEMTHGHEGNPAAASPAAAVGWGSFLGLDAGR